MIGATLFLFFAVPFYGLLCYIVGAIWERTKEFIQEVKEWRSQRNLRPSGKHYSD